MLIYVEGFEIETKEIISIESAGWRKCGFTIKLTNDRELFIGEKEPYDAYPHEVAFINNRYRVLRNKIEEQWNKDKIEHVVLNL